MEQGLRDVHEFHIPVMGTGFTIDTPLHAARYGISSVVSLVDDILIEQMRAHYCREFNRPYQPIPSSDPDARADRIRAYLDLLHELIREQVAALRQSPFEPGSEITRYYSLLPDGALRDRYQEMLVCTDPSRKIALEAALREAVEPGRIDVNIMTKLDRIPYDAAGQKRDPRYSDAIAALRGFATSKVSAGVVFSAGLNAALYSALSEYADFMPDENGQSRKTVILKVSDYRSAMIQGRFLAKRGIWVSEYRVESGLNCGGHAFATQGNLLGPILAEFRDNRSQLQEHLHRDYVKALTVRGAAVPREARRLSVTVQGGIGTHEEHQSLIGHFALDRTGWGTPFLVVPDVTSVDEEHLQRLITAEQGDIVLSDSSPLGVPFWTLKTSASEVEKRRKIAAGHPGSGCPKGYLELSDELTEKPVCRASSTYQDLKLAAIEADTSLPQASKVLLQEQVLERACICHDLGGGVVLKHGIRKSAYPAICPSMSILHFKAIHTLEEMVGHIYGRWSLLKGQLRPHMFIRELSIYIDYLHRELERFTLSGGGRKLAYYEDFKQNLLEGISYYQNSFREYVHEQQDRFAQDLQQLKSRIEQMPIEIPG